MTRDLSVVQQILQMSARVIRPRRLLGAVVVGVLAVPFAGCTTQQRQGTGSSYLIINSIEGVPGSDPSKKGNVLDSDVLTYVKDQVDGKEVRVPTVFEDAGTVTFTLGMKDPSIDPSPTNFITVNRYHVEFVRADGRNTPGVDVPYPFDGAFTTTVSGNASGGGFTLVRIQAKNEAPLRLLIGGGSAYSISTIARVTFYGQDQAGHEVSTTGQISVNFADWGDPN
ncbi:MAG: hypothetical protein ABI634_00070 [Acidobacteriota bacterium]